MLTTLGEFSIIEIIKLLNIFHDTGKILTDLKKSVYMAIPQTIDRVECDQHSTISLKYVGLIITPDARCDTEIKKRIALCKDIFTKMKSIFTNSNIRIYTKINTLKAYIWLLQGCECWTLIKDLERKLEEAEMWYIRRLKRTSWTEKK